MIRLDAGQIEVVDDAMVEILKRKKPCERIQIGFTMWESSHTMLTVHLRKTHPEWDDKEVAAEVARRFLHGTI
jgi:choline kinase